ncbi:ATPase [Bowmanella sp. Y26]|uniref:BadF/BadG/BcrA/BcrD ATPase family protein n=1 Tax=Bowmanella yangjiangensis TaxID=2811230 RepID=UPI001BDC0411|nr:BadF/BadG/BcrA/BcrD ATPase family protein [Bowmanella yangjiangensis]MBT1062318.1 ATPase [Bowmanella yangjiangensis]
MNFNDNLRIGLDGGGTKCKAILVQADKVLGTGLSGPGNPVYGVEQAKRSIIEASLGALKDSGLSEVSLRHIPISMGLAGVNLPELYNQMMDWMHPFKSISLTTDLVSACLGAHGGGYGAVVIVGTGSCGFCFTKRQQLTIGAHGFPQGDVGSGAWFGLQAVQTALLSNDSFLEQTKLTASLFNTLGVSSSDELVGKVAGKDASYFAALAHTVFECAQLRDPIALKIVMEGVNYIAELITKLNALNPPRISIIGGLSHSIISWLPDNVSKLISSPLSSPEMGAIYYSRINFNPTVEV